MDIRRRDIYWADLDPVVGNEQGKMRPVLIVQNDMGNRYSGCTIIVPLTTSTTKANLPTHVTITKWSDDGKYYRETFLCEHIRTIDKSRLREYYYHLDDETMEEVDKALAISIGLV